MDYNTATSHAMGHEGTGQRDRYLKSSSWIISFRRIAALGLMMETNRPQSFFFLELWELRWGAVLPWVSRDCDPGMCNTGRALF